MRCPLIRDRIGAGYEANAKDSQQVQASREADHRSWRRRIEGRQGIVSRDSRLGKAEMPVRLWRVRVLALLPSKHARRRTDVDGHRRL
jgi:hypothetical protein